jgi:antitoxin MazE
LCIFRAGTFWHQPPQGRSTAANKHFQQSIRRCVNSLALRLPADCLLQAGLRQGDPIGIVVGSDGRLRLERLRQLDRTPQAAALRTLQATMPLTPSVV